MRDQNSRHGRASRSLRREVSGSRLRASRVREAEPKNIANESRRGAGEVARPGSASGGGTRLKRPRRDEDVRITASSGNVFRDIGFPRKEAAYLLIRSDLMIALTAFIKDRGLTQARAARILGVSQPRVSDLMRGRIELFSIDTLIEMLNCAGIDASIRLETRRARA
jgi:predicted XRE-type DNA-binding protein